MIGCHRPEDAPLTPSSPAAPPSQPMPAGAPAPPQAPAAGAEERQGSPGDPAPAAEPILCNHCGRTASNGISCIGACVADSGY